MKLKKLFAGIVAVAMMATMAMPMAFAEGDSVAPAIEVNGKNFTIAKTYNVIGTAPNEDFELEQTKVSAAKSEIKDFATNDKYDLTIGKASYTGNATGLGFSVTLPDYDNHPGVYTYELKEKNSGTAGVTYDANTYTLTVFATQASSEDDLRTGNTLNFDVRLDVKGAAKGQTGLYKVSGLTNKYESGSFTVEKKVKGNMADRQKDFSFKVVFGNIDNMNGSITLGGEPITLADDNSYTFTLKHGESKTFGNIPATATVEAYELLESGTVINKTATGAGDVENGAYAVTYDNNQSATITTTEVKTTITNTSTENVDTGVILDNAPYMLMLAVVAGGAMTLVIKKRREEE